MRAYAIDRYGSLDTLEVRDVAEPTAGRGEVLVKVCAAALNPADTKVITGKNGGRFLRAAKFPLIPGFDFAGTIAAIGEDTDASGLAIGDRVYGFLPYSRKNRRGSFAEYLVASAEEIGRIGDGASFAAAAASATTGLTALQALRDHGGLESGQRVLINGGSGGVGTFAVQIAKVLGAEVWATASAAKLDGVRALGADQVLDYREKAINELEARFDLILDASCTSSYSLCAPVLSRAGAYVTLLPSLAWLGGTIRALFSSRRSRLVVVKSRRADLETLAEWMAEGRVEATLEATLAFEDIGAGLARLAAGDVTGKLAVDFAG